MNFIKRFLLIALIGMFSVQSYSQSFGLKGGVNLANMLIEYDGETISEDFTSKLGFHIGGVMEIPVSEILSFETGLILDTKGFKWDQGDDYIISWNLLYLDIPLTAKGAFEISDGVKVYGQAGPYIGIGLSGKAIEEYDGEKDEEEVDWGNDSDEDDLKRLDYGATLGAGVEFGSIQIGFSYDLGLANISAYTGEGAMLKHKILRFSLGYRFGL